MDIENAYKDPVSEFSSPAEVAGHGDLTMLQKREILERWKQDAELLVKAADESMSSGEPNMLDQVMEALDQLDG